MLNRKRLVTAMTFICISLLVTAACGNRNPDGGAEDAGTKNGDESSSGVESDSRTDKPEDDFKYLYREALEGEVLNKDENASVQKEYKVVKGEFTSGISEIGIIVYEDLYYEMLKANEADNVQFLVSEGDKVKKGDVLATYNVVTDDIGIAEQTRDVERMEKEYDAEYDSKKAEINMAEYELGRLTDKRDIEIKKLQIKKLKNSLEKFAETRESIVRAREELNEKISRNNVTEVVAGHDGYIESVNKNENSETDGGSSYFYGDLMVTITKREKYHIETEPHDGIRGLKYDSCVDIIVEGGGADGKDVTVKGRVIAAPNVISAEYSYCNARIRIIDEPEGVDWSKPVKVRYDGIHVNDALMVPEDAVMTEKAGGGAFVDEVEYVYIKKDDVIYKSYLNIIDRNNNCYRVCGGVSEGDTLVRFN